MAEYLASGETCIAFERAGAGPPLVLIHGAEASHLMFATLIPILAKHFTVIAYDQRDCGETQAPERPATLSDLAEDAHRLIRGLGHERAHVFGTSFGGRVAQALALLHPSSVDRLALGSTWPVARALGELNPDAARILELRRALPESAQELAEWFLPAEFLEKQPQLLRNLFAQVQPATARSQRRAATVQSTLDRKVSDISAVTLLLAGELDRVVPPAVTLSMSASISRSRSVMLPGVGHVTAMQAPAALAKQLEAFFLSDETEEDRTT